MQIGVRRIRHVIVYHNVDTLDVDSSADQVRGHQDPLVPFLEVLVSGQPAKAPHSWFDTYNMHNTERSRSSISTRHEKQKYKVGHTATKRTQNTTLHNIYHMV